MSAFDGVYDRGVAMGESDIKRDVMVFRFRQEVFELPLIPAMQVARYNGYFYEAPVDAVRKLEAEAASG
jgi:hypothetical protein